MDGKVGAGAIAVVLLATDLTTGARVAIKRVDPARLSSPRAAERLLRNARAAQRLRGEHVARVLEVLEDEGGAPCLVTEHLDGSDLAKYVERRGPVGVKEAVKYLLQACEAVAEAHAAGLLHRDLKPQNLFLTFADGHPSIKVLDFGTHAVACGAEGDGALTSSSMRDSLLYLAPEQLRNMGQVDERADVWAIGALGYLLVSGRGPFEAESPLEICARVLDEQPAPLPASLDAGGFEKVLLRCLEKIPERRYANLSELALALARFGSREARRAAEKVWERRAAPQEPQSSPGEGEAPLTLPELPDLLSPEAEEGVLSAGELPDLVEPAPPSRSPDRPPEEAAPEHQRARLPTGRAASSPSARPAPRTQPPDRLVPAALPGVAPPEGRVGGAAPSLAPALPAAVPGALRKRAFEVFAAVMVVVCVLGIWLVRGRVITFGEGGASAAARTGVAARVIKILRAQVERTPVADDARPAEPPVAVRPLPVEPAAASAASAGTAAASAAAVPAGSASAPELTPPPGGWEYPPELIYDEVERERRRERERRERERRERALDERW